MDYQISIINGVPVANINSQLIIIDTGSPVSFSASREIKLGAETITVANGFGTANSNYLSQKFGTTIHGLMGLDILMRKDFIFNYSEGYFAILETEIFEESDFSIQIPLKPSGAFISIDAKDLNQQKLHFLLDTGAEHSYINKDFSFGKISSQSIEDFNPFLGDFKAELIEDYQYKVDGLTITQNIAIAPSTLENILTRFKVDGLVGYDFFKKFKLVFQFSKNRILGKYIQ